MSIHQKKDGVLRFPMPDHADDVLTKDPAALNELLNLVSTGLNTNRYITSRLTALKNVGQKLDNAIMHDYGSNMH